MTPVTAPMVGKILQILVKPGDRVEEDDTLVVMEAMKMEIPVAAPSSGAVQEIRCAVGQMVAVDDVLMTLE